VFITLWLKRQSEGLALLSSSPQILGVSTFEEKVKTGALVCVLRSRKARGIMDLSDGHPGNVHPFYDLSIEKLRCVFV